MTLSAENMSYFYLKLGVGNSMVEQCLGSTRPHAFIFFGDTKIEDYQDNGGAKEVRAFIGCGEAPKSSLFIVIHDGKIWFLRPAGEVMFGNRIEKEDGEWHTPKRMHVEIIGGGPRSLVDVPEVLATLPANQYLARGTFRQITDWGSLKAIDVAAGIPRNGEHWDPEQQTADQILECIGSPAMETLVAKILEGNGCFIPAHRGGMLKDIDIIAHNDSSQEKRIGEMVIPAKSAKTIQVKRWATGVVKPRAADYLVGIDAKGLGGLGASWILAEAKKCQAVWQWFTRSIGWLPASFVQSPQVSAIFDRGTETAES